MSIVLRTLKGQALTYAEMDRNLSQYYYSSSLHNENTKLRLHFTGSNSLDINGDDYGPRYHEVQINTGDITIPEAAAAGDNTQIQYNNQGSFGASSNFVFDYTKNNLGIGIATPDTRLHILGANSRPAEIRLAGFTGTGNGVHSIATFYAGSTQLGSVGRSKTANSDIHLSAVNSNKIKFEIGSSIISTVNSTGLGLGTEAPDQKLSIIDSTKGIGVGRLLAQQNKLRAIPSAIFNNESGGVRRLFPVGAETEGLLIESPNTTEGGSIIVGLNTDSSEKEAFNIITARQGAYNNTTTANLVATFQASGKVGINTNTPSDVGLTVTGIISGSGNGQIDGTLTVGTIATGTADNTSALVTTSTGLVQKIAAAPVPIGGIIMWSGTIANIPDGWELCDGDNGTPDLTNRFVIGAITDIVGEARTTVEGGSTKTGGSADAVVVSHTHTINDPGHSHDITRRWTPGSTEPANLGDGNDGGNMNSTARTSTESTGITINTEGESGTNKNLPPYYALAFIMYVGT